MASRLPNFDTMRVFYKGDGWDAGHVKTAIGGSINSADVDDTCIVRISEPLNLAGGIHLIPVWTKPFRTRQGRDKRWYGLRVKEFWPYLIKKYGQPSIFQSGTLSRQAFVNKTGIIGFRVNFADGSATGHFTLWDGQKLLYGGLKHDYFAIAYEAALWQAGESRTRVSMPPA